MTNVLKRSFLVSVSVVMVMIVLIVSQANTYADGRSDDGNSHDGKKVKQVEVTNWEDNPCCDDGQVQQHDANMTADHLVLESKIDALSFSSAPGIPQPVQREFSMPTLANGQSTSLEVGRYTVPSGKRLTVELMTLNVQDFFRMEQPFYLFATTSIGSVDSNGSNTVKHSIGSVAHEFAPSGDAGRTASPIAGITESFQRTIYAEQGTDIIFTVVARCWVAVPIVVTFSGRLVDVP